MRKKGGNVGNALYDGAATVGRVEAVFRIIAINIIAIIILSIGIWLMSYYYKNSVKGVIKSITMRKDGFNELSVEYNINNKSYTETLTALSNPPFSHYKFGGTVRVFYKKNAPPPVHHEVKEERYRIVFGEKVMISEQEQDHTIYSDYSVTLQPYLQLFSIGLITFAVLMMIGSIIYYYIINRYKFLAAASAF